MALSVSLQRLEGTLEASRSELARLATEAAFVKAKADEYATELKKWMQAFPCARTRAQLLTGPPAQSRGARRVVS